MSASFPHTPNIRWQTYLSTRGQPAASIKWFYGAIRWNAHSLMRNSCVYVDCCVDNGNLPNHSFNVGDRMIEERTCVREPWSNKLVYWFVYRVMWIRSMTHLCMYTQPMGPLCSPLSLPVASDNVESIVTCGLFAFIDLLYNFRVTLRSFSCPSSLPLYPPPLLQIWGVLPF